MSYLSCGCWTGPWWSVDPPPTCDAHRFGITAGRFPVNQPIDYGTITTTTIPIAQSATTPESAIADLIRAIAAAAGEADAAGEIAQHDAWQMALNAARRVRELIADARAAQSKERE